ncbi:MAG: response regulator, partial [Bdellovibrionales bacterium]|nr:response regulator [Bdellovibrionales bacterium]
MSSDTTRVLVVDDSSVIRKIVCDALDAHPKIEVQGTALNGKLALHRILTDPPDLVILDLEMPEMTGMEVLQELKNKGIKIPVIIFSAFSEQGARVTLDALALGATDYVTKPSTDKKIQDAKQTVELDLINKILSVTGNLDSTSPGDSTLHTRTNRGQLCKTHFKAIAIGSSTGGPNALEAVLSDLPHPLPIPVFITQHMPPVFTKMLAERLRLQSNHLVKEAEDQEIVQPGYVYVAPGDFHMGVRSDGQNVRITLSQTPPENRCRPAVDVMLRSMSEVYG